MRLFLIVVLFLNSSCIHLSSTDYQSVDLETSKESHQETLIFDKLQIDHFIYTESVYPLEKFLTKLLAGDFNKALNNIDFKYTPSNTDNKIILELVKEGLVPVYVNIKNTGSEPIRVSEKNFYIIDGEGQTQALSFDNIPRSIKRFNPKAIVVNTYNISVVVVGTVVALAVLGIIFKNGSFPSNFGSGWDSKSKYSSKGTREQDIILNDTQKTTKIDYRKYLLSEQTVEPNQSIQGLLFFRIKTTNTNLHLQFQLEANKSKL